MFKDEANTQDPGSDLKGTSRAVLKGAKQLLTDKFFLSSCSDVKFNQLKRPMDIPFCLIYFYRIPFEIFNLSEAFL